MSEDMAANLRMAAIPLGLVMLGVSSKMSSVGQGLVHVGALTINTCNECRQSWCTGLRVIWSLSDKQDCFKFQV